MPDETDKAVQPPIDDIMVADPPSASNQQPTLSSLIKDVNELTVQLRQKEKEITPQFINSATREQIHAKRLEFKTLRDLYQGKIVDLSKQELKEPTIGQLKSNQDEVEGIGKRVDEMFKTSKFEIASTKKKTLSNLYTKLKDIREAVTVDYLQESSIETLQERRSEISGLFMDFGAKYHSLVLENLSETDRKEIVDQKVYVETATTNVDKFIDHAIKAKELEILKQAAKQPDETTEATEDQQDPQVGSSHQSKKDDNTAQIEELRDQIAQLLKREQTEKAKAAETIKRLEQQRRSTYHDDLDNSEEMFEDVENPMLGDPPENSNSNGNTEQAVAGVKIGSIDLSTFGGNLDDWEAFRDIFEQLVHNSK